MINKRLHRAHGARPSRSAAGSPPAPGDYRLVGIDRQCRAILATLGDSRPSLRGSCRRLCILIFLWLYIRKQRPEFAENIGMVLVEMLFDARVGDETLDVSTCY